MTKRNDYGIDQDHGHDDESEEKTPFIIQLDAEMRALTDTSLSNGAARLFCLLAKLGWKRKLGGLYRDRIGSILIDSRRLAKLCGGASVNSFYHKTRPEVRNERGLIVRSASETDGWIEELVKGGYIWIGKHRIPNIPPAKWPNIYNVVCHVPQRVTSNLPWADGNWGTEVIVEDAPESSSVTMRDRDFSASEPAGDRESPQNPTRLHRMAPQPSPTMSVSPSPHGSTAKHRNGLQPVTGTGDGLAPHGPTGKHRNGGQAVTGTGDGLSSHAVNLRETGDRRNPPEIKRGEAPAPDLELLKFQKSLEGEFPRELKALKAELKAELSKADDAERHLFFKARIAAVDAALLGGTPPPNTKSAPKAAPAKAAPEKPLTVQEALEHVRFCIGAKKLHLITAEQRSLARKHGVKL